MSMTDSCVYAGDWTSPDWVLWFISASLERCPDCCDYPEEGISVTRWSFPLCLWQWRHATALSEKQPRCLSQCDWMVGITLQRLSANVLCADVWMCRLYVMVILSTFFQFTVVCTFLCFSFSPPPSASLPAGPPPQMSPDEAEQQAVHLLACSADSLCAPLPPISMFDLLEALQVRQICFCKFLFLVSSTSLALSM